MDTIKIRINGQDISAAKGMTVLEAAQSNNIYIPSVCYDPDLVPYGACRLCIVRIDGMRGFPASCTTPVQEGMVVHTETEEIQRVRRMIVQLAVADHPFECLTCNKSETCDLLKAARYVGIDKDQMEGFRRGAIARPGDNSNPAFDYDPNKCILCGKCVRVCNEIVGLGAIDLAFRGYNTRISPFGGRSLAQSVCQSCGECVERCPTGALSPKHIVVPEKEVETICPYCGVGCSILLGIRAGRIVRVRGNRHSPVNRGGLCVKGRYGLDFVHHPERLTRPLIRRQGVSRDVRQEDITQIFREAEWDEALDLTAKSMGRILDQYGPDAIGVLSSAKCTNEDNYVIQKFARAVLGSNNIDHCARLCHASTVAAALASFGDGAMSNSISDIEHADVLFIIGSNTTECHPIIGRRIKHAIRTKGARLIVADPRAIEISDTAEVYLNHLPGTDVALLNGMMHVIVKENLLNKRFVEDRCEDFQPFLESLESYSPEAVEGITSVPREKIHQAAILFGRAKRAIVLYGMGITQHTTGTDNVKAIANLLMLTGNIGRTGTGFSPLRGQNNVQGACDMGALPNVYPGYQQVINPDVQAKFKKAWGRDLSPAPGHTMVEMFQAADRGRLKALYIVGENPMLSEADLKHAGDALAKLDFLVAQDIFPTETAMMADVVFPACSFAEKLGTFTSTERRVQMVRRAVVPPGEARPDWEITTEIALRLGYPMDYKSEREIMEEISSLTPIYAGISYDRLMKGGIQWPCWDLGHPGTQTLHEGRFTRGRGKFHAVKDRPPAELPSGAYPMLLTTGRILEHWHTGSMSHRSRVLEALAPESRVEINPGDALHLGIEDGDIISLSSRRGNVRTKARPSKRIKQGLAFMPFHWRDAPVNLLTNPALDPLAKIPEYKVSSVKIILEVLERAMKDNEFLSALANNPEGALKCYNLNPEHRAALASGDIESIENWIGPLDKRLHLWIKSRLEKENLSGT